MDVNDLEESLATVPHLNIIEGAENIVATVNKDRKRSNFTISIDGMSEISGIEPGEYAAFCALWDVPINSSNGTYGEVQLHSIKGEKYWNGVNYLVNNLDRYFEDNEDLTWLEAQIALWSIMDHKKFDLESIPVNEQPSYVRGGNFSHELINTILLDVEENKDTFDPSQPGNRAYYAQLPGVQDQIIIIPLPGSKEKGFGVRFRNLTSSAAQQEIYLGVGDLGNGSNRVQEHATYIPNGTTVISFAYDPQADEISASAGNNFAIYENLSANMPASCSLNDVDRAELWIASRDPGTTVTLSGNLAGQPISETADGDGVQQRFFTLQNIDISSGFTLMADLTISGTFTDGERGKVELVLGCPVSY